MLLSSFKGFTQYTDSSLFVMNSIQAQMFNDHSLLITLIKNSNQSSVVIAQAINSNNNQSIATALNTSLAVVQNLSTSFNTELSALANTLGNPAVTNCGTSSSHKYDAILSYVTAIKTYPGFYDFVKDKMGNIQNQGGGGGGNKPCNTDCSWAYYACVAAVAMATGGIGGALLVYCCYCSNCSGWCVDNICGKGSSSPAPGGGANPYPQLVYPCSY